MFQTRNLTSKVALSLATLATVAFSSSSVFAQASTIFSDDFEAGIGNWTVNQTLTSGAAGAPTWSVDATPSTVLGSPVPFAGTACLNYNNGLSYDDGGLQNAGFVTLNQSIAVGAYQNPELKFQQNWNTESGTYDQKRLQISNDNFSTFLLNIDTGALTTAGNWTQVVQALDPTWGTIQIRFSFDTIDGIGNATEGWFIDDFLIEGVSPANEDVAAIGVSPQGSAFAGQLTNYDVTVTNIGTGGLTADGNVDVDIDGDGIFDATGSFTGLAAGGAQTVVTVSATAPGTVGNTGLTAAVTLTSGVDGNTANDTTSSGYNVLPTDDVEITSVSSAGAAAGSPLTINVDVTNNGLTAADGNVDVDIDNDGIVDVSGNFTGLASGATVTVAVLTTAPGTAAVYTASATVVLTSAVDAEPSNDTGSTTYTVTPTCTITFPAVENFDSFATGAGAFNASTGWEQDTADGGNWTVFGGNTGSVNTGPTQDFTTEQGLGSGLYLYTETSGPAVGTVFNVISPCYDLSFLTAPQVQFYVHMVHDNQTAGEFHLDVLNLSTGLTDMSVWSQIGQLQGAEADPWEKVSASLAAHAGDQVRLRWRSIVGGPTNFVNDTGLDQVTVGDAPTDDVGINSVTVVPPVFTNAIFNVDVEVENFAQNAADGDVNVDIDGDGIADGTNSFAGLAFGTTTTVSVTVTAPGIAGPYTADATVVLTSGLDSDPLNDTGSANFTVLPTDDVEVTSVTAPAGLLNPGDPVQIDVVVTNNSQTAADLDVTLDYENDGIVDDTQSLTGLASTASQTVTFNTTAPTQGGQITVSAAVLLTSSVDQDPSNDTGTDFYDVLPGCVATFPYLETFDTWTNGANLPVAGGWTNASGTTVGFNWLVDDLGTPSSPTGPNNDVTSQLGGGSGKYMFVETSGGVNGEITTLDSRCLNLTTLASPTLKFYYHMFGTLIGDLHVDILDENDVVIGTSLWNQNGQVQTSSDITVSPWESAKIGLGAYVGQTIKVRFRYIKNGGCCAGDAAIDHVSITEGTDDIAVTDVALNGAASVGSAVNFDVTVYNFGLNAADGNIDIDVDNDGINDGSASFTGLASGTSTVVTVSAVAPLTIGNYTASATATLTSAVDGDTSDNSGSTVYTVTPSEDIGVVSVVATPDPVPSGSAMSFDVDVQNLGASPADILVEIDFEDDGIVDASDNITGLASGATGTSTFNTTAPGTAGNATASVAVTLQSGVDGDPSNNTGSVTFAVTPSCVTTYPYLETFDTWPTGNGAFDITTGWIQNTNDNQNWTVFGGSTGSSPTGPTQDYTNEQGGSGGLYLYTETSGPAVGNVFAITSICFDMAALAAPKLSFFYHAFHNNQTAGEFHVDVENLTTGVTDSSVWSLIGQFQTAEADPWENEILSLLPYAGDTVRIIFRTIVGGGTNFYNDTGLDQVSIFDAADDVSVTAFSLNGASASGNPIAFDVEITNTGSNAADGTVDLDVDNDGVSDGSDTFTGLASGASVTLTINATAPIAVGNATAVATANLTSGTDGNPSDNTANLNYVVAPNEDLSAANIIVGNAYSGMTTTFSVDVTNNGGSTGDGTVDFDVDNDGVADGSANFTGLASGATTTVSASITAGTGTPFTVIPVAATVTLTSGVDGDPSNDTATSTYTLIPTDDVSAQNLTGPTAPADGSTNNYDFELVNNGINPASGTFDFDVDTDGTPEITGQAYGPIAPGDTLAIMVTATVPAAVAGSFTATVTQTLAGDGDPSNNSATLGYTVPLAGCGNNSLTTTFASGNGSAGNMFDITAINDVVITCFDVHFDPGVGDFEVWYLTGGGTYVGNETNAANWTMAGSITGVPSASTALDDGTPTQLPILINVPIAAGATQGFYVTRMNGSVNYTNGTAVGNIQSQDANIQFKEGAGGSYFSVTITPRIFNGNIIYDLGAPSVDPPVVTIDGADLSWPAVTNANNYWVYQSANPNGPFNTSTSVGNVLTWTDPAGAASAEPFYYVTADTDAPVVAPTSNKGNNSLANNSNYQIVITDEMLAEYKELEAQGLLDADVKTWLLSMYPNLFEVEHSK
ncbi:MAG: hypothetical protein DWQ06_15615 [Calditrichaeota bacterium]|nr:MAG: hypothetical protein DWQ06_15615 [Calditrichota bacterium]